MPNFFGSCLASNARGKKTPYGAAPIRGADLNHDQITNCSRRAWPPLGKTAAMPSTEK
jgi:hypothetical protein